MAKTSKVEDYWKQNNVESLFKELTQIIVRRMPSDPAVAIVEHLQKKFPGSFKRPTENIDILSKTTSNNLKSQPITSARSSIHNESIGGVQSERRLSNQSQVSGIVTIPTLGSAFTDLLKKNGDSATQAAGIDIRNIVFASRLGQQGVQMGKDIRSDHDILEEEVLKPIKTKSTTNNMSHDILPEDLQNGQTHEEPSVRQLIKYKQQIRTENDRRLHREKLADLAKEQREKEKSIQSDLSAKPEEILQQKNLNPDNKLTDGVPEKIAERKSSHKTLVHSKEEEEILNDETSFQPRQHRYRDRKRNKLSSLSSNIPYGSRQYQMPSARSPLGINETNIVCKHCGHIINEKENELLVNTRSLSLVPTTRPSQPLVQSTENDVIDSWFESEPEPEPDASSSRGLSPMSPNDGNLLPIGSSTFRRNLFQPIKNIHQDTIQHRPSIPDKDKITPEQSLKINLFESDVFSRSPDEPIRRRPSSTRSVPSPVQKSQKTDTRPITINQLKRSTEHSSALKSTAIPSNKDRRVSDSTIREDSPTEN